MSSLKATLQGAIRVGLLGLALTMGVAMLSVPESAAQSQAYSRSVSNPGFTPTPTALLSAWSTGTVPALGDDAAFNVPIGFTFTYGATQHTRVSLCSNGFLQFMGSALTAGSTSFSNAALGTNGSPDTIIAGCWDDLVPTAADTIYYGVVGAPPFRVFVARWNAIPLITSGARTTFEIRLTETANSVEIASGAMQNLGTWSYTSGM